MTRFRTPNNAKGLLYGELQTVAMLCDEVDVVLKILSDETITSQKSYYTHCRQCKYHTSNICKGGTKVIQNYDCRFGYKPENKIEYIARRVPPYVMVLKRNVPYFYCIHPEANGEFDLNTRLLPMYIGNVDTDGSFCIGEYSGSRDDHTFLVDIHSHFFNCVRNDDYNFSGEDLRYLVENWSPREQYWDYDPSGNDNETKLRWILDTDSPKHFQPGEFETIPYGDPQRYTDEENTMHFDGYSLKRVGD